MRSDRNLGTQARRDGVWPRTYRLEPRWRAALHGFGALALVAAVAASIASLRGGPPGLLVAVALGFGALSAYLVAVARVERLLLHADGVEVIAVGRAPRRLRTDQIAGRRTIPLQYGMEKLVLERRERGAKPLSLTFQFERDAALDAWLASIPDLDAADRAGAEAALLASAELGADEAARRSALARSHQLARALKGVAIGVAGWGLLFPRPYPVVIAALAAIPLATIALVVAGRGRYAVEERRNEVRPGVGVPVFAPGVVLMLRALLDYQVVDVSPMLAWTGAGAVALTALLVRGDAALRRRWFVPVLIVALVAPYPWGALNAADVLLDRAPAEVHEVPVLHKHVSSGKHTSYDLRLPPWGPIAEAQEVDVGRELYGAVEVGDVVCAHLRPGALGARWFVVDVCD
ncbi:hypothetical protein [Anaeromyxobacter dehalogenans]|uniref:Uncharacterized protein n=1 Tax=Anaeromyxobacter dehalogenans (strain 2CP-C) TaxID=290397 RepID=Q2IMU0_ANADE|nr:hypothetical protein [Anaeromyxobacter dehalogenans]ABC80122.1 hypothetical protein Adeh_0346 [Anaeromyxobacter dehalogenans 2CP-C]